MILDNLTDSTHYENVHPLFPAAFAHLRGLAARSDLPAGRIELDGDRVYAIVAHGAGRPRDKARTETHRRYIDIQYTLAGTDLIGWLPASECPNSTGYDDGKDIEFYTDRPELWFEVKAGQFAIFLPGDAHAPMANEGQPISKIVIKVAV
jgi:YhcH/YjgK/YiaL family protein